MNYQDICTKYNLKTLQDATLRYADLQGAKLQGANFRGANFQDADLTDAKLQGAKLQGAKLLYCIGNGREIKTMLGLQCHISFTKDAMAIGCHQFLIDEWLNFSDEEISSLDPKALDFWKEHKGFIFEFILRSSF